MIRNVPLPRLAAILMFLTLGACQPVAQPVEVHDITEMRATVVTIDRTTRQVLLRGQNGGLETIVAGPEVRNLDQVNPGDRVVARVHEALAVQMARPGSASDPAAATLAARAAPGASPAAARADVVYARVRILATDMAHHTVTVIGPAGVPRVIEVIDPQLLAFASTLKAGDEVDVAYAFSVAVAVVPDR